jgi:hypothetical protein
MIEDCSSNSSKGLGNSIPTPKQCSPAKKWCFTLNNWHKDEFDNISSIVPEFCDFAIIGSEVGESGTPHLQGFIEFKVKKRPKSVFDNNRIHWEKAKGNRAQNIEYCSKESDVLLHWPKPKVVKCLSEEIFYQWEKDIVELLNEEPDDRTIHWYFSEDGNVGKTSFCKYLCLKQNFIMLGGKAADCRNGVIEYTKANHGETPERICINIPRSFKEEYVSYEGFENLKDMLFYSGKYEGGMVCGNCPHLFIFANFHPDCDKMSVDRWNIKEIIK